MSMRDDIFKAIALLVCLLGLSSKVVAAPIAYDFSASGFIPIFIQGGPVPYESLSGSFTLDGTQIVAINLTIGSHSYTLGEVGVDQVGISPISTRVGALNNGFSTITGGTDDFLLSFVPDDPTFGFMNYAVQGVSDVFSTANIAVTVSNAVPEPSTLSLMVLVGVAGIAARRKRIV
jgi:hypothetical protein